MPTVSGTEKRETFTCPQCGAFLWTEGVCDPCKGSPGETEVAEENNVTYKHDQQKAKVVAKPRKK